MQPQTLILEQFLATLNDEADVAAAALRALPVAQIDTWPSVMVRHPEWCRFGTFDALLSLANAELYNEPKRSLAIVSFVLPYAERLEVASGAEILRPLLLGMARKELAAALNKLGRSDEAVVEAQEALAVLEFEPALVVDHAVTLLVYAHIEHQRGKTAAALEAVKEAAAVFNIHARPVRYMQALEMCAFILVDQEEFVVAQEVYATAYDVAERLNDTKAMIRLENNRGLCAVYLGAHEDATHYLTRALLGFERENMHGALQQTVWNLARAAREKKHLDDALRAFYGVYAEFVHRGMIRSAAQVLVELGDIIVEMTEDPAYARDMCRRAAQTMGEYDVIGNVRDAVDYLRGETASATSRDGFRAAFAHVRVFLQLLIVSPTLAFVSPQ